MSIVSSLVAASLVVTAGAPVVLGRPPGAGRVTGGVTSYLTVHGDTFSSLRARFGVDVRTLVADNELSSGQQLPVGQRLRIDNRHILPTALVDDTLVVNVPQRMLFHDAGGVMIGAPLAVGLPTWRTPIGRFTIVSKEVDPTWDVPVSILEEARRAGRRLPHTVPPGPSNPLGKYWLGLSVGGVGIHGTNAPSSIYQAVTHGCMRLSAADIATVFARVEVGAAGVIVYEPVLMALEGDEVLLEVHPDVYGRAPDPRAAARALARSLSVDRDIDWERAERVIDARHGIARPVGRVTRVSD